MSSKIILIVNRHKKVPNIFPPTAFSAILVEGEFTHGPALFPEDWNIDKVSNEAILWAEHILGSERKIQALFGSAVSASVAKDRKIPVRDSL